jgi:cytochrome b subunit of formate dehydrogenase
MIVVITIIFIIGILLIWDSIRLWNKDIQRIKELEERLSKHYKEREKRLRNKGMV